MRWIGVALLIAVIAAAVFLWRPSAPQQPPAAGKLLVVATIFPLADWLREVGGADVEVHCLVSGGSNPHHFEPSMKDAAAVTGARAVFAVGLGLDEWAGRLAANAGRTDLAFFETGEWITPRPFAMTVSPAPRDSSQEAEHRGRGVEVDLVQDHQHGKYDPHYWLDPLRASEVVKRMAEELGKLDPPRREAYQQRAEAYDAKLKQLEQEIGERGRAIASGAQIVTFHDAYGYLLDRLGITVAAVIQSSPGVEPSARDVSEALRILRQTGQRTVFEEPGVNNAAAQTIAREIGARLEVLDPLDSEASSVGKTYLERMRHNIAALAGAVGKEEGK